MSNEINETDQTPATPATPAVAQVKSANLIYSDGMLNLSVPEEEVQTGERQSLKKNEKGEKVKMNNGTRFQKFVLSHTQKELLEGAGSLVTRSNGEVERTKKISLLIETKSAADVKRAQEATNMRDFVGYVNAAAGLGSKVSKQYLTISAKGELLSLSDLQLWVAGGRTIRGRNFSALNGETQTKIKAIMGKLGDKAAKKDAADAKSGVSIVPRLIKLVNSDEAKAAGIILSPEDEKLLEAWRAAHAETDNVVETGAQAPDATPVATPELQTA